MNIWRAVHRELRSASRSLRYDLHRPGGGRAADPGSEHTAPLPPVDPDEHPAYDAYARRTRRVRTAMVVATLAVGGAVATYFGVVGGLSALLAGETAAPGALPWVNAQDAPGGPHAGVGASDKSARPAAVAPSALPSVPMAPAQSSTPGQSGTDDADDADGQRRRPTRTVSPPRRTESPEPPVPTPAPHPTPTCSETPTPSPSPSQRPTSEPSPPPVPPE